MKKMYSAVIVLMVIALVGLGVSTVLAGVAGTKHDITSFISNENVNQETCVFCHTPHQTTAANLQDPLWNRSLATAGNFGAYSSTTSTMAVAFGGGNLGSANTSQLCMSCHDGQVAVNAMFNLPNIPGASKGTDAMITGTANLGTGASALENDHPINFTYATVQAMDTAGLASEAVVVAAGLPLYGAAAGETRMQCATCHDVHNNTYAPFLRIANTSSNMCKTCHINK